jgi:hypothetical protein
VFHFNSRLFFAHERLATSHDAYRLVCILPGSTKTTMVTQMEPLPCSRSFLESLKRKDLQALADREKACKLNLSNAEIVRELMKLVRLRLPSFSLPHFLRS